MKSNVFPHPEVFFRQRSLDIRYTQGPDLLSSDQLPRQRKEHGKCSPFTCSLELNRLHFTYIFVACTLLSQKQILTLKKKIKI